MTVHRRTLLGVPVIATMMLLCSGAQAERPPLETKLRAATEALRRMSEEPSAVKSAHYHVLYVGRREFAEDRKRILEKTRKNFLGFMRRMQLDIGRTTEKLLVIVLDTQGQMIRFREEVSPDGPPIEDWVAGYYSPEHNWAVFYNQRKGSHLKKAEEELNRMARRLLNARGGPDKRIHIHTPDGWVRRTKKQIGGDMTAKWKEIIAAVNEFNTAVTQHEGAHQLAFNVGVQQPEARYPVWVSEGLACQFEVPPGAKGRRMGAARVNGLRLSKYREVKAAKKTEGLHRLLKLELDADDSTEAIGAMYAESWAVFAFLFHRHAEELSAYLTHLANRGPPAEGETVDEVTAFAEFFDTPILELQKELDAYIAGLE